MCATSKVARLRRIVKEMVTRMNPEESAVLADERDTLDGPAGHQCRMCGIEHRDTDVPNVPSASLTTGDADVTDPLAVEGRLKAITLTLHFS